MANNEIITYVEESTELDSPLLETNSEKYQQIESELNELHENLTTTIDKLTLQIPKIIEFADSAQHPKVYEALARVVQTYSGINKDAAAIIKQKQELYDSFRKKESSKSSTVNNDNRSVHFVGTTNDLLNELVKK